MEQARRRGPDLFLLAEIQKRIVGAVLGRFGGRRGWGNRLAVSTPFQSLGTATALLSDLYARPTVKKFAKINLRVLSANRETCAFYERIGYSRQDLVFMGKWLRKRLWGGFGRDL